MTNLRLRVEDLPPPPPGRVGFPWTEGTRALPKTLPGGRPYPIISIVTPSYKQGQYLEETIRSVLLQGYPGLEYIIIDGGSPDNSVEIIQKYAPFLTFWVSERDKGQADAINKGFARSTGEIMGWLNSDDALRPNALYQVARKFALEPDVHLVTGFRKYMDEHSQITSNCIWDRPTHYYVRHYCCISQEVTYWRRAIWDQLEAVDTSFQFAMDYEFWLRALDRGYRFHVLPTYLGCFRDYVNNKTNSWLDTYYADMAVIYRRFSMGIDEADVHAQLGNRWARRYSFYKDIQKQAWTNSPWLIQLTWFLLESPVICEIVLGLWYLRKQYLGRRDADPPFRLRTTSAAVMAQWGRALDAGMAPTRARLRDIRQSIRNRVSRATARLARASYAMQASAVRAAERVQGTPAVVRLSADGVIERAREARRIAAAEAAVEIYQRRARAHVWAALGMPLQFDDIGDADEQKLYPADTLVFGSGWSPTGFSDSEFFRRCSGIGDILILNGSGRPKTLWLVIAPTVAAAGSSLEIIDEHGVLIGHAPVEHPRAEIKIDLKPAAQPRARYSLRFRRLTGAEAGHHWSHASFRLLRMSWESSQAALEAYARAFHDAVEDARPLLGPLPPAGQLEKGLRRWSSVETVMASQFALYQQLWSHLSLLEETQE